MPRPQYPLALDRDRRRFTPPINAHAWRVRRVQPRWRGYDAATVRHPWTNQYVPLCLHLRSTLDDLTRALGAVPGTYRLDFIDDQGYVLAWTPAYAVLPSPNNLESADPEHPRYRLALFHPPAAPRRRHR